MLYNAKRVVAMDRVCYKLMMEKKDGTLMGTLMNIPYDFKRKNAIGGVMRGKILEGYHEQFKNEKHGYTYRVSMQDGGTRCVTGGLIHTFAEYEDAKAYALDLLKANCLPALHVKRLLIYRCEIPGDSLTFYGNYTAPYCKGYAAKEVIVRELEQSFPVWMATLSKKIKKYISKTKRFVKRMVGKVNTSDTTGEV